MSTPKSTEKNRQFEQPLGDRVNTVEQEARMVLPGIQALFGFQLIAIFNEGFKISLSHSEQVVHLIALLLVAVSAALVMAPAAYHRQAKHQISAHFVEMSGRFLAAAMVPLAVGTCLDIFLITQVIIQSYFYSTIIAGGILLVYSWTWFIFPQLRARKLKKLPVQKLS